MDNYKVVPLSDERFSIVKIFEIKRTMLILNHESSSYVILEVNERFFQNSFVFEISGYVDKDSLKKMKEWGFLIDSEEITKIREIIDPEYKLGIDYLYPLVENFYLSVFSNEINL